MNIENLRYVIKLIPKLSAFMPIISEGSCGKEHVYTYWVVIITKDITSRHEDNPEVSGLSYPETSGLNLGLTHTFQSCYSVGQVFFVANLKILWIIPATTFWGE